MNARAAIMLKCLPFQISAMRPAHKRKETHKGFDLLDAVYAEKGLISGGDSHTISSKAIGETHGHSHRHLAHQKEKRQRAEFVTRVGRQKEARRAGFMELAKPKPKEKQAKLPPQMKRKDSNPSGRESD